MIPLSGSPVRRVSENHNVRTPTHGYPASPFRYVFRDKKLTYTLPTRGRGRCSRNAFWPRRVWTDQRQDEVAGEGGGQPGSMAMARRLLTVVANPVSFKSPLGERLEATQDGGGSQPEERPGVAAGILIIIRRRKSPVRGDFGKIVPYPLFFEKQRLDPSALPTPPLVGT
jgi:hypothetical protein